QRLTWLKIFVALGIGVSCMHLMLYKPMMREMAQLRRELSSMERDMEELVGARDQIWETNNLLSTLRRQADQFDGARAALSTIRDFRQELEGEAGSTVEAYAAL